MAKEEQKKKPSIMDRGITAFSYLIVIYFVISEFSHLYRGFDTIKQAPDLYEPHYSVSSTFPFVGRYFLMVPKDYNPKYKYPLVVSLHGVSSHSYAAEELAREKFRNVYPFFVMVPIAPKRAFWMSPKDEAYRMPRNIPYPDHMPQVIAGINDIQKSYSIDSGKIILAGHSMGGSGVIGAMQNYSDIFSAGIASAGAWSPNEIASIKSPLFVYHGTNDGAVPASFSAGLRASAKAQNLPITVTFLKGRGHGIGNLLYSQASVWDKVLMGTEM